ncbi:MAG: hypothetical protein AAF449_10985 [Myxococcota bacterium]
MFAASFVLVVLAQTASQDHDPGHRVSTTSGTNRTARVAVLPVLVDGERRVTASEIFRLVSQEAQLRKTLRLMSIDEFFFNDGGALANGVLACGSDTGCVARQLAPFQADLGLVVIVNGKLVPPLLGLLTIDTHTRSLVAERYEQVDRAQLMSTLRTGVAGHFDTAGHPQWGRLDVQVEPPGAGLRLSPDFPSEVGRPGLFIVPPGAYQIFADKEGYEAGRTTATVTGGASAEISVTLTRTERWYESPWLWVGTAVVIAAAAAVTAVSLAPETNCGCVLTDDRPVCPPCP